jgi:kinetochore protein NNF1
MATETSAAVPSDAAPANPADTTSAPTQEPPAPSQDAEAAPPPSPPLPTKPVALAPGPRASRLHEVFTDRVSATLEKVSYANFAACYPTVAAAKPGTLKAIHSQVRDVFANRCEREFQRVLGERDVVAKLNALEGLIAQASRRRAEGGMDGRGAGVP